MTAEGYDASTLPAAAITTEKTKTEEKTEEPAVQQIRSFRLLKFEGPSERPVICEEGLEAIRALPGPICPVAFVGDGRSGKSFLASKICGTEVFQQDDSDVAVTEGIDVAILPSHPGHIILLDCEGGNNAMSKSHTIVTVIGALVATALAFVTDGKASEAAIEALAHMLEERKLIKCDGTGSLQAQSLLFIVNQNRLRYGEDSLEKILTADKDEEAKEIRSLISETYSADRRQFFTVPHCDSKNFDDHWTRLDDAIREAATPLKMGKLWMTGAHVAEMLNGIEKKLRNHGKISLPSLHRHVILDSWLKPTISQVLSTRMDKLMEDFKEDELAKQRVGSVKGNCMECKAEDVVGWMDPDIDEFFCEACWMVFSPKVLKCGFCNNFVHWPRGRVETVTKQWHCVDCLMQLGIDINDDE